MSHFQNKIPQEWIDTQGEGVVVGLCDTWVDVNHPAIKDNILEIRSFSQNAVKASTEKHGTHLAGLIVRMAPRCKLAVGVVTGQNKGRYAWLEKAMQWMEEISPDVVNLSLVCKNHNDIIYNSIKNLHKNDCIITAPGENNTFPGRCSEVVSVGRYGTEGADLYTVGNMESCTPMGSYADMKGVSVSCAIVAGICACAQAYKKGLDIVGELKNAKKQLEPMPNPYKVLHF
jgi:hypothetical protein